MKWAVCDVCFQNVTFLEIWLICYITTSVFTGRNEHGRSEGFESPSQTKTGGENKNDPKNHRRNPTITEQRQDRFRFSRKQSIKRLPPKNIPSLPIYRGSMYNKSMHGLRNLQKLRERKKPVNQKHKTAHCTSDAPTHNLQPNPLKSTN